MLQVESTLNKEEIDRDAIKERNKDTANLIM